MALWCGIRHLQCFLIMLTSSTFTMQWTSPELSLVIVSLTNYNIENQYILKYEHNLGMLLIERLAMTGMSIVAGIWSVHKGVKYIILAVGLLGTILMYTCNLLVNAYGWEMLIITRVIFAIGKSFIWPLLYGMLPNWIPDHERGRLVSIVLPGLLFGYVMEFTVGFYLGKPQEEWVQMMFWTGNCSVIWAIAWWAFSADHPKKCFFIERNERRYIQEHQQFTAKYDTIKKIPWSGIFLTGELYPLIFTHACYEWTMESFYDHTVNYFYFIYKLNMDEITILLSYGYIAAIVLSYPVGMLVDKLAANKVSVSKIRKVSNCIGFWGIMAILVYLSHAPNLFWAKLIAASSLIFIVPIQTGFFLSFFDLSPNFCGLLYGISAAVAYSISFWVPIVRQAIIKNTNDKIGWNKFFYTAGFSCYFGGLVYALFLSADVKSFNKLPTEKTRSA